MNPFYVGGIIGFAPALFLLWFGLRRYTVPFVEGSLFEDRKVFFLLAIGMVAGTLIFTLEQFLSVLYQFDGGIDFLMFMLIYVLAFPLIEDLAKFTVLNFKGYEGRFDSVFYGISLGAGYSATAILGYVIILMNRTDVTGFDGWLGLFLFSICTALVHCSVGATLGSSTAQKLGLRGLAPALIPHMLFNMLMFPWFVFDQIWFALIFAVPISALIYYNVHTHTIPEALPNAVQKEMRRNSRRKDRA